MSIVQTKINLSFDKAGEKPPSRPDVQITGHVHVEAEIIGASPNRTSVSRRLTAEELLVVEYVEDRDVWMRFPEHYCRAILNVVKDLCHELKIAVPLQLDNLDMAKKVIGQLTVNKSIEFKSQYIVNDQLQFTPRSPTPALNWDQQNNKL